MTLLNMPATVADIDVSVFPYSDLTLVKLDEAQGGRVNEARFKLTSSNVKYPLEVRATIRRNLPRKAGDPHLGDSRYDLPEGSSTLSIGLSTFVETTVGEVITTRPIEAFIGIEIPTGCDFDMDDFRVMWSSIFALTFTGATSTVPENTDVLNALLLGITHINWA